MRGLLAHLKLTLRLNFRARQALVYGYLVPIFFLLAFGSVFHASIPPLLHEIGQLVTITVLGGACFGMPTSMVSERERGVWRRYRLLPGSAAGLVVSTMVARYVIVLLAVVMQFALAWCLYRTPLPALPGQELVAYTAVCFAFLGMGLIIAMLADRVPAVQALGQAIFLPMIMIGGVGVPLRALPEWAQRVASYLPGRYAVEALDACYLPGRGGLGEVKFALMALVVIGGAACVAGSRMFRWDAGQKPEPGAKLWIIPALAAWLAVGIAADLRVHGIGGAARPLSNVPWENVTQAQIDAVDFKDLPPDDGTVAPIADDPGLYSPAAKLRVQGIRERLPYWTLAQEKDLPQRVRNFISAACVFDLLEDRDEGAIGSLLLGEAQKQAPPADMERVLTYIIEHPSEGTVLTKAPELGADGAVTEAASRQRVTVYATKLLKRLLGR